MTDLLIRFYRFVMVYLHKSIENTFVVSVIVLTRYCMYQATFAVEAYLTEAFTSKPFATLSTYAFVAASWSLDGSVTFVILLELTSTVPEPLGSSIKSMFASPPADPILTPLFLQSL